MKQDSKWIKRFTSSIAFSLALWNTLNAVQCVLHTDRIITGLLTAH